MAERTCFSPDMGLSPFPFVLLASVTCKHMLKSHPSSHNQQPKFCSIPGSISSQHATAYKLDLESGVKTHGRLYDYAAHLLPVIGGL